MKLAHYNMPKITPTNCLEDTVETLLKSVYNTCLIEEVMVICPHVCEGAAINIRMIKSSRS